MTEQKAEYKTKRPIVTAAFSEPNHTQTPNNFFEMIPDMGEAELRVTLVMFRNTFGWHRNGFKMGVSKLAAAAGLSRQGALDGAREAEERGTFRRSNPDAQGEAEWELIVAINPVEASSQLIPPLNPVEASPQPARGQSPVKESKETIKDNNVNERTSILAKLYSENIGLVDSLIKSEMIQDAALEYTDATWYEPAFKIAVENNVRNWRYIETVLRNWKEKGRDWKPEVKGNKNYKPRDMLQERYGGIIEWAKEAQDNDNTTRNGSNNGKVGGSVPQLKTG